MTRAVFLTVMVVVGCALSACIQGRDYQRPEIEQPVSWDDLGVARMPGVVLSTTSAPEVAWWRSFGSEELTTLIERALGQNHDVRRAAYRVVEGHAFVASAAAGRYPQVNVQTAYSHLLISENTLAGLGLAQGRAGPQVFAPPGTSFDLWSAVADLRWELDLWGRIRRGMEAAVAEAGALEQDRRAILLSLIAEIAEAYFRLRELDDQLDIAERNLAVRRESHEIIVTRASVGLASDLDVKRAEVLVSETAAQIPELRRLRTLEQHHLEVLIGAMPGTLTLAPMGLRSVVVQPDIPVGLPSQLLERRPDIVYAEQTLVAANARIGEARAYFFPAISITGQGGVQSVEFSNWFSAGSLTYSIGPAITLPIFLGGTNVARLGVAESRYEQMLEAYRQTILTAFREVADQLVSIAARNEQLSWQREQVAAARVAAELARVRYHNGLVTYLDVLEGQRTVLGAETQLVQTERARLADLIRLFKALGGGWAEDRAAVADGAGAARATAAAPPAE